MSESIAARVDDNTARWLQETAEQEDTTVSKVVASILNRHARDVDDEPDSTEVRINQLESELKQRITQLDQDIQKLTKHSKKVEREQHSVSEKANGVRPPDTMVYPPLPGDDEGTEYEYEPSPTI